MIAAIGATIPAIALGWLIVRLLSPNRKRARLDWLFEISLGAGVGLGLTSCIYFAMLLVGIASRAGLFAVELVAIAALAMLLRRSRTSAPEVGQPQPSPQPSSWIWVLRLAAAIGIVSLALSFSETIATNPNGEWDAFSIWNVRAKYLAGGSPAWHNAFGSNLAGGMIGAAHPGYPLLVSASIARVWTLTGETSDAAPAAISLLFTLAACGLLAGAIASATNEIFGWLALLVLIATEAFATQAAFQYADVPLAFFILATIAIAAAAERAGWPPGLLALTGLAAGFAAFTKNEGLPFALLIAIVALWRARGAVVWMLAGAIPGIAATLAVKLLAQGTEAILPKTAGEALHKIAEPSRWMQILGSFARSFGELGVWWAHPLLLIAVLAVVFGLVSREAARSRAWLALPIVG
ncbi:MAG TPA: phospholipid carrier-dependent glycosyltransferase, partial [Bryobacteraceae bacterium]|nr:phospholipid carrier-dependent glycosyltransferase [Bryobacteraceae bacterium]